ncbi:hypothetical protein M378DRAFT_914538 [Amanita muscaria Koide BX008]|uniref:Uncharacterized protein n=1 Tax=Amanita muscaria (strain Koide BX008) TaxID=946122 RepID=A0A0C2WW67_AMAMK|nr:hypothetical protein M378DRAFT_914538 [Amanita muscaria Koide BX008]
MEPPRRNPPLEDSQRRATRRKYNLQQEQSNLDEFLQQRGTSVPRVNLKRPRLENVPGSAASARVGISGHAQASAGQEPPFGTPVVDSGTPVDLSEPIPVSNHLDFTSSVF